MAKAIIMIGEQEVTFRELTIKEFYTADLSPPTDQALIPLYVLLGAEYPLVTQSADCAPELLLDACESELTEAFRKANPFSAKPVYQAMLEEKNNLLGKAFSGMFAVSLNPGTAVPGIIPSPSGDGPAGKMKHSK